MSRRRAFTLGEILIAVAIMAIMSALIVPTIMERIRQANAAALKQQLQNITTAILTFREHVGEYPQELYQLTVPIEVGDKNICGNAAVSPSPGYVTSEVNKWKGPYLTYDQGSVASGMKTVDGGIIDNVFLRNPDNTSSGQANATLQINVSKIERDIAFELDSLTDAEPDVNDGTVQWGPTGGTLGQLRYYIPIRGC